MANNNQKRQLKNYLIFLNIGLAIGLFLLLIFGILVVRTNQIHNATRNHQYVFLDLNNLPLPCSNIEPGYIGDLANKDTDAINLPKVLTYNTKRKPQIAIIISNLGLNKRTTELALFLPKQIGFGFLPYTTTLRSSMNQAQIKGHEIYLYLPLEGDMINNHYKAYTLMNNMSVEENMRKFNNTLNSQNHYTGVYSSTKEVFTDNKSIMFSILSQMLNKDLVFILGKPQNPMHYMQDQDNVINTDIIIDSEADEIEIKNNLNQLIKHAKKYNTALGYSQGYAITINILHEWLKELEDHDIELVCISDLLKQRINH